ncbi:MAG: anthranilate phosphoribosyltransferase [Verrucomicrobiota bacterium]
MHSPLRQGTELCQSKATLPESLLRLIVQDLFEPAVDSLEKKSFLEAFSEKGETPQEVLIFSEQLLEKARPFPIHSTFEGKPLFDSCGTGGGGLDLFNVSTAMVPILAALGIPVVKHGNRGLTKKSGSADAIEALGIPLQLTSEQAYQSLQENGCVFLLAQSFHPHFKIIAPIRQELGAEGKRTIFNLLGPLLNPAKPKAQLLGVFRYEHLNLFHSILNSRQTDHTVVLGRDIDQKPIGEVSPWGHQHFLSSPTDLKEVLSCLHLPQTTSTESIQSVLVANAKESVEMILSVLKGKNRGLARDMVVINATVGLLTAQGAALFSEAKEMVEACIDSGKAFQKLQQWQQWRPQ